MAFKPPGQIDHSAQNGIEQGKEGLAAQVSTHLCPDDFDAAEFNCLAWKTVLQRFLDLLSDILPRPWRLSRADEDFVLIPKMLHDTLAKSYLT